MSRTRIQRSPGRPHRIDVTGRQAVEARLPFRQEILKSGVLTGKRAARLLHRRWRLRRLRTLANSALMDR